MTILLNLVNGVRTMANMLYIFKLSIGLFLFLSIFPLPSISEKTNNPTDLLTNSGKTKDAKGDSNKKLLIRIFL